MTSPRTYRHFCATARALEVIGERWTLLVVRDLLEGPQRFTDLVRSLSGITPKQLTKRLRELETAGIVARDASAGYGLTAAGEELAPVVESLTAWGTEHARRPPQPDEAVHPRHVMSGLAAALNREPRRGGRRRRAWTVRFSSGETYALRFDGTRWRSEPGEAAGAAVIETTPRAWASFLADSPENVLMLAEDERGG